MYVFPKNMKKLLYNFASFPNYEITFTGKEQTESQYQSETTCQICNGEFIGRNENYHKVRDYTFNIQLFL